MKDYTSYLADDTFVIFLFHGVINPIREYPVRNYNRKHILVSEFREVLRSLVAAGGNPITMDDVVAIHNGVIDLPRKSFAITFDDGFQNAYWYAAPILVNMGIPATFYLTIDFVFNKRSAWIDLIEQVNCLSIEALDLLRKFVRATGGIIDEEELGHWIGRNIPTDNYKTDVQLDWKMEPNQATELYENPLFTIGGHGLSHVRLEHLSKEDLDLQLLESISTTITAITDNNPVRHYSYPEGLPGCWKVAPQLKWRGIICCPTAIEGVNTVDTDLFQLKRVMVV